MTKAEKRSAIKSYEDAIRFLTQEVMYATNEYVARRKMAEIEALISGISELQTAVVC